MNIHTQHGCWQFLELLTISWWAKASSKHLWWHFYPDGTSWKALTHAHAHTNTHTFQAWVSLVGVFMSTNHVACWRNLTTALPSWVALTSAEIKDTHRVTTLTVSCKDSLRVFLFMSVCVCVFRVAPLTFDVKTHSTCCSRLWSHPCYSFDTVVQPP